MAISHILKHRKGMAENWYSQDNFVVSRSALDKIISLPSDIYSNMPILSGIVVLLNLKNDIESVQHEAAIIVTGATKLL